MPRKPLRPLIESLPIDRSRFGQERIPIALCPLTPSRCGGPANHTASKPDRMQRMQHWKRPRCQRYLPPPQSSPSWLIKKLRTNHWVYQQEVEFLVRDPARPPLAASHVKTLSPVFDRRPRLFPSQAKSAIH